MTSRDLAEQLGVDQSTVIRHLNKYGSLHLLVDKNMPKETVQKVFAKNVKEIKKNLNDIILTEGPKDKAGTVNKIEGIVKYWQRHGITLKGFNAKSIYRKIQKAETHKGLKLEPLKRKTRGDKGTIRNNNIAEILETHILPLAANIYFQNAKSNLKLTVDLMIDYAKTDENFYEIAAMSPHTLRKVLRREFMERGMEDKHELLNHYNLWFAKKRATVTGAFTDDIEFMDYLLGDDNKRNVASAWVYNPKTRKKELKQIRSWNWVEAKTGKILSYKNTTGDLTAEDVIETLIEALQKSGLPNKGIIIDNGIGSSAAFKNFFNRLNNANAFIHGNGYEKIKCVLGKPYHPLDKAPVERSFGWTKEEFDTFAITLSAITTK